MPTKGGWITIMTNWAFGCFYVGVTNALTCRVWAHKEGLGEGHTKRYRLKKLAFAERHEAILAAIQREKISDRLWQKIPTGTICSMGSPDRFLAMGMRGTSPRMTGGLDGARGTRERWPAKQNLLKRSRL